MGIIVKTIVFCQHEDGCEHKVSTEANKITKRETLRYAKKNGWARVAGKDYCPDHKPTRVTMLSFPVASPSDRP